MVNFEKEAQPFSWLCLSLQEYGSLLVGGLVVLELIQHSTCLLYTSTGNTDLVDVELFSGDEVVRQIVACAHKTGVATVGSSHDFHQTPPEEEIVSRLERMATLGCDIAKIAVMPQNPRDVLTLLSATERMHSEHPEVPIITMSMGQLGMVSRLCGEVFGSALTFGAAGQASAPGQAPVQKLRQVLNLFHGTE